MRGKRKEKKSSGGLEEMIVVQREINRN